MPTPLLVRHDLDQAEGLLALELLAGLELPEETHRCLEPPQLAPLSILPGEKHVLLGIHLAPPRSDTQKPQKPPIQSPALN